MKILGLTWDKKEDELLIEMPEYPEEIPVTKRSIISHLGKMYDPLGIASPTMAEGKRVFRQVCDQNKSWNSEVSEPLRSDWLRWTRQLRSVKLPRAVAKNLKRINAVYLHIFADASNLACSCVTVAVIEQTTGTVKGLLASKSRISKRNTSIPRLELVSGQMAANMARNICLALKRTPMVSVTVSVTVWMDSLVALFWISNPAKSWKVFVANRVRKIASITAEIGIQWKYCPTKDNIADLGSRGASIDRMERGGWFTGPEWLLNKEKWPEQSKLTSTKDTSQETVPMKQTIHHVRENVPDEWDLLLERNSYWRTLRVTAWVLRFVDNSLAMRRGTRRKVHSSTPHGRDRSSEELLDPKSTTQC